MQQFKYVNELLKVQRSKYTKYKILYDALWECVFYSSCLDKSLKLKVQDILLHVDCAQVVCLEGDGFNLNSQGLLDLTNIDIPKLTHSESLKLKKGLDLFLKDKYKLICQQFFEITGKNINIDFATDQSREFNLSYEDETLLKLQEQLEAQNKMYVDNLIKEQEVLNDLVKLRLEKLPPICDDKIKECCFKSHVSELQTKLINERTRINIFMETSNSLLAYEELLKDIKEQQEECQRDIQYLKNLKKQYQQIDCKQYDELLKSFIQYRSSLEKKRKICQCLHGKSGL